METTIPKGNSFSVGKEEIALHYANTQSSASRRIPVIIKIVIDKEAYEQIADTITYPHIRHSILYSEYDRPTNFDHLSGLSEVAIRLERVDELINRGQFLGQAYIGSPKLDGETDYVDYKELKQRLQKEGEDLTVEKSGKRRI